MLLTTEPSLPDFSLLLKQCFWFFPREGRLARNAISNSIEVSGWEKVHRFFGTQVPDGSQLHSDALVAEWADEMEEAEDFVLGSELRFLCLQQGSILPMSHFSSPKLKCL